MEAEIEPEICLYATVPWCYPMQEPPKQHKGRLKISQTLKDEQRCLKCPMIAKFGLRDCRFHSVSACKKAERTGILPPRLGRKRAIV